MIKQNAQAVIEKNKQFWEMTPRERPLFNWRIGSACAFDLYAGAAYLRDREFIQPEDIIIERFFDDYPRMIEEVEQLERDVFWVLEPFFGVPWINMILGCRLSVTQSTAWCHPPAESPEQWLDRPIDLENNAWFLKLIEFTDALVELSAGRYPVGQPLLRGPSDLHAALVGDSEAVYGLMLNPELNRAILERCTHYFIRLIEELHKHHPEFMGGYTLGYYNLWIPEPGCRFQEDATALYSPELFRQYVAEQDRKIALRWPYNVLHLHASAIFLVEQALKIPEIRCIEVDFDREQDIPTLIHYFKRVQQAGRPLIIDGFLGWPALELLLRGLKGTGTEYQLKTNTVEEALALQEKINQFYRANPAC